MRRHTLLTENKYHNIFQTVVDIDKNIATGNYMCHEEIAKRILFSVHKLTLHRRNRKIAQICTK